MFLDHEFLNGTENPTLVLGKKNYDILGILNNFSDLNYEYNLNSANSISFCVYKTNNTNLWNEITDRRLVWIKEINEWFEITVEITECNNGDIRKDVNGTSLCETELGQININGTEINTENDIAREDYVITKFYNTENHNASLLHRILKKAPHYSIGYVEDTLKDIQRTFSWDGQTILDVFNDIGKEIGCLFLYDTNKREINVYDLETNCRHCGHRGEYLDICPKCGSTDLINGYGKDTTILVDTEKLTNTITLSSKTEEYKNYFKLVAGDDTMSYAVAACNPNGTQYIYSFSETDKKDMSTKLVTELDNYKELYDNLTEPYQDIMLQVYNCYDELNKLQHSMMPTIEKPSYGTASDELAKIQTKMNMSTVSMSSIKNVSTEHISTANNAVISYAKCFTISSVFKITVESAEIRGTEKLMWQGRLTVTNVANEDDTATTPLGTYLRVYLDDNYENFVKQKLDKLVDRNDVYLIDIFEINTGIDDFRKELTKYSLERLKSFENAYTELIDAMTQAGVADYSTYGDIHNDLYIPYYEKLTAIQSEILVRDEQINNEQKNLNILLEEQKEIQNNLDIEDYLGKDLYKELCSFIREDIYENSNYISDGLDNSQIFEKAKEFYKIATKEIYIASTLQYTLSSSLNNFLAVEDFKPLATQFEGGNWIRCRIDNKLFRLRLIHYVLDFNNLETLNVEFSDVTITSNGLNDIQSVISQAQSMSSSFNYIAHQASQGSSSFTELDTIKNDGLNTALYSIKTSDKQEFVFDSNGIIGRQFDDELDNYSPEQIKIVNNMIAFTNDNWLTAKSALGKITYEHPLQKEMVTQYGLIADAVISGIVIGNDIIGGNIYSSNYSETDNKGTHFNLITGDFSLADNKIIYSSEDNKLTFKDVTIDWTTTTPPTADEIMINQTETINEFYNNIYTVLGLEQSTQITTDSIISPKIGGGYLYIVSSDGKTSVEINPNKESVTSNISDKVGNPYQSDGSIFSVKSNGSEVIGFDNDGNSFFNGKIQTISGSIGGWTIDQNSIYRKNSTFGNTNGMYFGTSGLSIKDKFKVNSSGSLTATAGSIGAFNISNVVDTDTGFQVGSLYADVINTDSFGHGDQNRIIIQPINLAQEVGKTIGFGIQRRFLPPSDNSPWQWLWGVDYNGNNYVSGQVDLSGGSYPQIYGNGSYLQLASLNDSNYGVVIQANAFRPASNGNYELGNANHKWGQIYSAFPSISTSDKNEKNTIKVLDDKLIKAFIMKQKPVSYKYNNGTSDRNHYGLISQDVEEIMNELGMSSKDFAGFIKSPKTITNKETHEETVLENEYSYGLRYEEFIAPIISVIQSQQKEIDELKSIINNKS